VGISSIKYSQETFAGGARYCSLHLGLRRRNGTDGLLGRSRFQSGFTCWVIVMGFTLYGIDIPLWLLFSLALIGLVTCVVGGTVGVVTIIRRLMRNGQAIDWRTTRHASGTPILRAR
jgi:hypothetical protein